MDDLISAGHDLNVMEKGSRKVSLGLTQEFVANCKRDMAANIARLYRPILEYLSKLDGNFCPIYADIGSANKGRSVDLMFEAGCEKIEFFKK